MLVKKKIYTFFCDCFIVLELFFVTNKLTFRPEAVI